MITLTSKAVEKFKEQLQENKTGLGIRLEIRGKGCSGFSYVLDFAQTTDEQDHVIEQDGLKFFVDQESMEFVRGTTIDYKNNLLSSHFVFDNPNETGKCGCGSSFRID